MLLDKQPTKEELLKLADGQYRVRRRNGSLRVFTVNNSATMTDQSFKKECDAKAIVKKYMKNAETLS